MQVIVHILCEGQTEDLFARSVLRDHLSTFNIVVKTQILITNKKKRAKGGLLNYQQAKNDLELMMKSSSKNSYEKHYDTTMFDYYALPNDFPKSNIPAIDSYQKIENIEAAFGKDINNSSFIPYIQLHEFEALIFCGLDYLLDEFPDMRKQIANLKKVVSEYNDNPEEINSSYEGAPSRRIIKELENHHSYNKPKLGKLIT